MAGGPIGMYHTKGSNRWAKTGLIAVLAVVALVAFCVYEYNKGPGRDHFSANVDQYGREMR